MILQAPIVNQKMGEQINTVLAGKLHYHVEIFNSECSDEEISRISHLIENYGAEIIVGIGGGKTLDTAKATSAVLKRLIVIVPTQASTDAPCSSLVFTHQKGNLSVI